MKRIKMLNGKKLMCLLLIIIAIIVGITIYIEINATKTVQLKHNNVFNGVEGILSDIREEIDLPKELYIDDKFSLDFKKSGEITKISATLFGRNSNGKRKSFKIDYDIKKSNDITVSLNVDVNESYAKNKSIDPLINTMEVIPIKSVIDNTLEENYGIIYMGERSWGYDTKGIIYIDHTGDAREAVSASEPIVGHTVSIYVPDKEDIITPYRYNLVDDLNKVKQLEYVPNDGSSDNDNSKNSLEQTYISKDISYKLDVMDAAAGKRFYSLSKTEDRGKTWTTINDNPFLGSGGGAAGITFINDKVGFLGLSHSGGTYSDFYRTEDGGVTYQIINYPEVNVKLNDTTTYNPYDFPNMPYEKDGSLYMKVGQGADGDYKGNNNALYQSDDMGLTWKFLKECE